jgi:hypothetical protein
MDLKGPRLTKMKDVKSNATTERSLPPVLPTMAGSMEQVRLRARVLFWRWLGKRCWISYHYSAIPPILQLSDWLMYWSFKKSPWYIWNIYIYIYIYIICIYVYGQPTYEKVNGELFLDKPLRVILNKSKLAYRIYVILIANKEFKNMYICQKSGFSVLSK